MIFKPFLFRKNSIFLILVIGAVLRILFVFIGGEIYYGRADFFIQGDTRSWFDAFIILCERGVFTINPAIESGKYFRPPGYSFLFGFCYLIALKNFLLASRLLVCLQL